MIEIKFNDTSNNIYDVLGIGIERAKEIQGEFISLVSEVCATGTMESIENFVQPLREMYLADGKITPNKIKNKVRFDIQRPLFAVVNVIANNEQEQAFVFFLLGTKAEEIEKNSNALIQHQISARILHEFGQEEFHKIQDYLKMVEIVKQF